MRIYRQNRLMIYSNAPQTILWYKQLYSKKEKNSPYPRAFLTRVIFTKDDVNIIFGDENKDRLNKSLIMDVYI